MTAQSVKIDLGADYTPGTWTSRPIDVTFKCQAPVAGVFGFFADTPSGSGEAFVLSDTGTVRVGSGQHTATATCVDLAGYALTASLGNLLVDQIAPTLYYVSSETTPNFPSASGWYSKVKSKFGCVDADSGPVKEYVEELQLGEGFVVPQASCADKAGNVGHGGGFNAAGQPIRLLIDRTPPTLSVPENISISVNDTGSVPVTYPDPTASDTLSGRGGGHVQQAVERPLPVGVTTVTCSVEDLAGNKTTASFTVTVAHRAAPQILAVLISAGQQTRRQGPSTPPIRTTASCGTSSIAWAKATSRSHSLGTGRHRASIRTAARACFASGSWTSLVARPSRFCPSR